MPERAGHGDRDEIDYYATHPGLTKFICETVKARFKVVPKLVLEPGCGAGTFLHGIRSTWPSATIHGIEIHEDLAAWSRGEGFEVTLADLLRKHWGRVDLVIGNPPFRLSEPFIHHLRDHLTEQGLLVFLLRLNFMAAQERYETLWSRYKPAHLFVLPARPGFTADGSTDATDYGVYVWRKEPSMVCEVDWLDTSAVQLRWAGKREVVDKKTGVVLRPAVLDPAYPDPRRQQRSKLVPLSEAQARSITRQKGQKTLG